jgi:glucosamine-6-phosphate deaminase
MVSVSNDGEPPAEGLVATLAADALRVYIYETRQNMGKAAAALIASDLYRLTQGRRQVAVIFASAPSQREALAGLAENTAIEWNRVTGFHLDEYLGVGATAPQSFRRFLFDHLLSRVSLGTFYGLRGEAVDPAEECVRYAKLLRDHSPDIGLLGIGENGHLAFIDPPYCDFEDPASVKVVTLDEICRNQQVHDGAFPTIEEVPRRALSLTIPRILSTPELFAIVPGPAKRGAVLATVSGPISTSCPASILRTHPGARLFLDRGSAGLLSF